MSVRETAAMTEVMGVPVATLHRDGFWTHEPMRDPFVRTNALNLNVYTLAQARALADDAVAKEREACAMVADELAFCAYELSGREIGQAIRARGQGEGNG